MGTVKGTFSIGLCIVVLSAAISFAHNTYTGYSGAPGSSGTCTPCHGIAGGTIVATGFPVAYTPGAQYVVRIAHSDTGQIQNFNASCRVGTTSTNAGTIAAGAGTAVYNVTTETNGVHFVPSFADSGNFHWTAPASGTGTVKLYVAGIQSGATGKKTALVLTATESTTSVAAEIPEARHTVFLHITGVGKVTLQLPRGFAPDAGKLEIFDIHGSASDMRVTTRGTELTWEGIDRQGRRLSPGAYFFMFRQNGLSLPGKLIITR